MAMLMADGGEDNISDNLMNLTQDMGSCGEAGQFTHVILKVSKNNTFFDTN
jgi:hypothetical protein